VPSSNNEKYQMNQGNTFLGFFLAVTSGRDMLNPLFTGQATKILDDNIWLWDLKGFFLNVETAGTENDNLTSLANFEILSKIEHFSEPISLFIRLLLSVRQKPFKLRF
jgi:hypothetical protein